MKTAMLIAAQLMIDHGKQIESAQYPESIFGRLPAGFVLEQQSIHMLAHWHRKSLQEINESPATDEELSTRCALSLIHI